MAVLTSQHRAHLIDLTDDQEVISEIVRRLERTV